ncbi:MAG: hypothetical protein WCG80_10265 [Spirochaetales bacterium]
MKNTSIPFLTTVLFLGVLASCVPSGPLVFSFDTKAWSVYAWKADGSHQVPVQGRLLQGNQPVKQATVTLGSGRTLLTDGEGRFSLSIDRTFPHSLAVTSVEPGTNRSVTENLLVYYPISVLDMIEVPGSNGLVELTARANVSTPVQQVKIDFAVQGTVTTADGQPAVGAVVSQHEQGGEGWAISTPADAKGFYAFYLAPEADTGLLIRVNYKNTDFTFPPGRFLHLLDDLSMQMDLILPSQGTTILDKPPTLSMKPIPGKRYRTLILGAKNPQTGSYYEVTLPDAEGNFRVKLPKADFQAGVQWVEAELRFFSARELVTGDWVGPRELDTAAQTIPFLNLPLALVSHGIL